MSLPEDIPNVGEREYPYMGQPNVTYLPDKILYNYPVDPLSEEEKGEYLEYDRLTW